MPTTPQLQPSPPPSKLRRLGRIFLFFALFSGVSLYLLSLHDLGPEPQAMAQSSKATQWLPVSPQERKDLLGRMHYLIHKVYDKTATPEDMPKQIGSLFQGEWALVTHMMTAIAIVNLTYSDPTLRPLATRVLDRMIQRLQSPKYRAFDRGKWGEDPLDTLQGNNGHIGYLGEFNAVLAARHMLGPTSASVQRLFQRISLTLARRIQKSPNMIAETYPAERYIPDNSVAIASIAIFDKLFPPQATGLPKRWIAQLRKCCMDPRTQLPSLRRTHARGSFSTWNVFFLSYADEAFARQMARRIKQSFTKSTLGLVGIREWAQGIAGSGDIDSGPLVFGISPSATGFAFACAKVTGDARLYWQLRRTAQFFGRTTTKGKYTYYRLSPLVGEAIVLATRTTTPWDLRFHTPRPALRPALRPTSQPAR